VHVSPELLDQTAVSLASFARSRPSEGLVYWFGLEMGEWAVITTLIVPAATTTRYGIKTTAAVNATAVMAIAESPLVLIGQAHSHPHDWVDHSATDDRDTFAQYRGALSVVVPWFGRRGLSLKACGVHRHDGVGFRRLAPGEVSAHLVELPRCQDL